MATKKTLKATADYEKDTAKGKRRYNVEGDKVSGSLYFDKGATEADTFEITLAEAE